MKFSFSLSNPKAAKAPKWPLRQDIDEPGDETRLLEQVAALMPDLVYIFDLAAKRCIYRNRSLMETLGVKESGNEDGDFLNVVHPQDVPVVDAHYKSLAVARTDDLHQVQVRMVDGQGETRWWSMRSKVCRRDALSRPTHVMGSFLEITDTKQYQMRLEARVRHLNAERMELESNQADLIRMNERLTGLATRDGLTGAYNHRAFQDKLAEEIARAFRRREPLSLIMADIDDFKAYNDRFGHPAGDDRLREFVETVLAEIRTEDFVCRYGGEEFAIVLPHTFLMEAAAIAQRILDRMEARQDEHRLTASFGCAELDILLGRADELIRGADQALYLAKKGGKRRIRTSEV